MRTGDAPSRIKPTISVKEPSRWPGKARFMLPPSTGEVRRSASTAGRLSMGTTMTRPESAPASRSRTRFISAMGPSYSSPWLPPVSSTVGPSPPRKQATGTLSEPQAEESRDHGATTELQAGMCFHTIYGIWMDDWGMEISQAFTVNEAGIERFYDFPTALHVKA